MVRTKLGCILTALFKTVQIRKVKGMHVFLFFQNQSFREITRLQKEITARCNSNNGTIHSFAKTFMSHPHTMHQSTPDYSRILRMQQDGLSDLRCPNSQKRTTSQWWFIVLSINVRWNNRSSRGHMGRQVSQESCCKPPPLPTAP